jgi:hypothetical protein
MAISEVGIKQGTKKVGIKHLPKNQDRPCVRYYLASFPEESIANTGTQAFTETK